MTSSSFYYHVLNYHGLKSIAIIDRNIGSMSVTRDIDNVVAHICNVENIDEYNAIDYLWLFADEDLVWDAYDPVSEMIIELACNDYDEAIMKYYRMRKEEMRELVHAS